SSTALDTRDVLNLAYGPMLRYLTEPLDPRRFEPRTRLEPGRPRRLPREPPRHRSQDERGALLPQPLDHRALLRDKRAEHRRLAVQELGDGALFMCRRRSKPVTPQLFACQVVDCVRIAAGHEHTHA